MSERPISTLLSELRLRLPELARDFSVGRLWVFGSVVRGEDTADSDLDIAVEFVTPPTFRTFYGLEECLERVTHRRGHLVSKNMLKPIVRERMEREGLPV